MDIFDLIIQSLFIIPIYLRNIAVPRVATLSGRSSTPCLLSTATLPEERISR